MAKRVVPDIDDLRAAIEEKKLRRRPRLESYNSPTRLQARSYRWGEKRKKKRKNRKREGGLPTGQIVGPRHNLKAEQNTEHWREWRNAKFDENWQLSAALTDENTIEWDLVERQLLEALEASSISDTQVVDVYEALGFDLSVAPDQKRRQLEVRHHLNEFFFTEFITFQPNGRISVAGKSLEQELPNITLLLSRELFGRNATKSHRRHKCLQGFAFFEGELHDHVHLLVWSIYEVPIDEMQRGADRIFTRFFPKGTTDIAPIRGQRQRRKAISYATKEIWKNERFRQFMALGPHPSIQELSIPGRAERAKQQREKVCRNPPDLLPDLEKASLPELKGVIQELIAADKWDGPDPCSMSIPDLKRTVRGMQVKQQRENQARAEKKRRAKYRRRAEESFSPFAVRLTPDLDTSLEADLGSLPSYAVFPTSNLIRGPPAAN